MEFGAVGAVIEKISDPIIDFIRNSHISHFIKMGGMSDCIKGLAKVQGNDTNINYCCRGGTSRTESKLTRKVDIGRRTMERMKKWTKILSMTLDKTGVIEMGG